MTRSRPKIDSFDATSCEDDLAFITPYTTTTQKLTTTAVAPPVSSVSATPYFKLTCIRIFVVSHFRNLQHFPVSPSDPDSFQ
jgi:hypothetical protein